MGDSHAQTLCLIRCSISDQAEVFAFKSSSVMSSADWKTVKLSSKQWSCESLALGAQCASHQVKMEITDEDMEDPEFLQQRLQARHQACPPVQVLLEPGACWQSYSCCAHDKIKRAMRCLLFERHLPFLVGSCLSCTF